MATPQRTEQSRWPDVPRGMDLLNRQGLNKGTAFTEDEGSMLGLHGLLPPHIETLDEQVVRAYEAYQRKEDDLERHIYLRGVQDTNEILFYRLLLDHLEEMTPMVYTPVVALAENSPARKDSSASLLPALADLRKVAVQIAIAVGLEAQKAGMAPQATEEEVRQQVVSTQWNPAFPSFATADNK
jgi:malic enzyme